MIHTVLTLAIYHIEMYEGLQEEKLKKKSCKQILDLYLR